MKKLLLSCFFALGFGANAQYAYVGDFEDPGYNTTIYKQFGGGTRTTAAACNGTNGGQLAISSSATQTGYMIDLSEIGQTGNGQITNVSFGYKKASTVTGTLSLAYFVLNSTTNQWSVFTFGTPLTLTSAATTTCATLSGTIPAGVIQPGQVYGVGAWFVRSGSTSGNIYVDDITVNQEVVTTVPACTAITYPASGSTVSAGNLALSWSAAPTAVNYDVTVGTTPGASDLANITVAGTSTNLTLATNTTYYVKVIPKNLNGSATGCTEISFTTNNNIGYCGPITASAITYPISSVSLNGVTNTSSAVTGAPAHEDFTATVLPVYAGIPNQLTLAATGLGTNRFGMTVFVDWNNDGDFNDSGEQYFTSPPLIGGTGATVNLAGNIAVPDGVSLGNKRMRIKYNFNSSTTALIDALSNPCANLGNGQVEDYTLSLLNPPSAPICASVSLPVSGSTDFPANGTITWNTVQYAAGYKVYIGTTPGGIDIANGIVVTGTTYKPALQANTMYYLKVVPYNPVGDAAGCTEISFTTTTVQYCGPLTYSTVEPTTNVTFAGINNTTSATVGGTPAHEFFLDKVGTVLTNASYPISMNANTDGSTFRHFFAVFIDWNQDGDFDDAGEKYFTSPETFVFVVGSDGVTGAPAVGSIVVPEDAKLGQTRMRVKSAYYGSTGPNTEPNLSNFANACLTTGSSFGQVEDYTIQVNSATQGTSNVDKAKVSVYPNPFHDVLNISDVKGVKFVSVSDVAGRQVKTMKAAAQLNLSDLKTGLYIVTLHMEDGSVKSVKAIKK